MQLYFFDYESYFSADYSLSRSDTTTYSYIVDPRFRAHGMAYVDPQDNYGWVTHDDLPRFYASLDWDNIAIGCHHAQFDLKILAHHYGRVPKLALCTKAMGNLLLPRNSKRLADLAQFYNLTDKSVPYNIFRGLQYLPPHIEHQVAEGAKQDVYLNKAIFLKMMQGDPSRGIPPFPPRGTRGHQQYHPPIHETILRHRRAPRAPVGAGG